MRARHAPERLDIAIVAAVAVYGQTEVWNGPGGGTAIAGPRGVNALVFLISSLALLWRRRAPVTVLLVEAAGLTVVSLLAGGSEALGLFVPWLVAVYSTARYGTSVWRTLPALLAFAAALLLHDVRDPQVDRADDVVVSRGRVAGRRGDPTLERPHRRARRAGGRPRDASPRRGARADRPGAARRRLAQPRRRTRAGRGRRGHRRLVRRARARAHRADPQHRQRRARRHAPRPRSAPRRRARGRHSAAARCRRSARLDRPRALHGLARRAEHRRPAAAVEPEHGPRALSNRPGGSDEHAQARARHSRRPGHPLRPHAVEVTLTDDGHGRPADQRAGPGRGLLGMQERAALYCGEVRARNRPGRGFEVRARLPLEP